MIRYITTQNKSLCCGCRACTQICPVGALHMQADQEGFLYPSLKPDLCIHCGLCNKVCPMENADRTLAPSAKPKTYALWSNNSDIRTCSSSGGMFSEIASVILKQNGSVFGAAFDSNFQLQHIQVRSSESLHQLRGSKYLQSDTLDTYTQVHQLLKDGHEVYYTGTPCQIAGLKLFLRRSYSNLMTSDLICHGVPSQKFFDAYRSYLEQKHNGHLEQFSFRDLAGWSPSDNYRINGRKHRFLTYESQPYRYAFLQGMINRPACYQCPFTQTRRTGDITIADFWGIQRFVPQIDTRQGVSLILVNTEKGERILQQLLPQITIYPSRIEDAAVENGNLTHQTLKHSLRDKIYTELDRRSFSDLAKHEFREPKLALKFIKYIIVQILTLLGIKSMIKQLTHRFK